MIKFVEGNLMEYQFAQALVNTVNLEGFMGKEFINLKNNTLKTLMSIILLAKTVLFK